MEDITEPNRLPKNSSSASDHLTLPVASKKTIKSPSERQPPRKRGSSENQLRQTLNIPGLSQKQMDIMPLEELQTIHMDYTDYIIENDIETTLTNTTDTLDHLNLESKNLTTGQLLKILGRLTVDQKNQLQTLNLKNNNLTILPETIGDFPALKGLHLNNTSLGKLPETIGKLSALEILDLTNTRLRILPVTIGNLYALTQLLLKDTFLKKLPDTIGNLSALKILDLDNTPLEELPDTVGNLSALTRLYLENTYLYELPPSIGNLSSLEFLFLKRTDITRLPVEIGNLSNLQIVDIRTTNLAINIAKADATSLEALATLRANGCHVDKITDF